jgi:pyruvate/2-oxoglutarate/acetoin dehydrogenase E1 component
LYHYAEDTIRASLCKTHKLAILDESTRSGGVGATMSALVRQGGDKSQITNPQSKLLREEMRKPD